MKNPSFRIIVASELNKTPLQYIDEHEGACRNAGEIIEHMRELREFRHRFQGAWKITVEKVSPRVVKTWRAASKEKAK